MPISSHMTTFNDYDGGGSKSYETTGGGQTFVTGTDCPLVLPNGLDLRLYGGGGGGTFTGYSRGAGGAGYARNYDLAVSPIAGTFSITIGAGGNGSFSSPTDGGQSLVTKPASAGGGSITSNGGKEGDDGSGGTASVSGSGSASNVTGENGGLGGSNRNGGACNNGNDEGGARQTTSSANGNLFGGGGAGSNGDGAKGKLKVIW